MSVKDIIANTYIMLRNDEKLLRLLYYPPSNVVKRIPDPLSDDLDNILDKDIDNYWKIVDEHVFRSDKADDLQEKRICRIYVYAGKKRRSLGNARTGKREIVVDVFCNQDFDVDYRLETISDRLSDVLFLSRVDGGLGTIDYRDGYDFTAPKGYSAYRHIFEVGETK